MGGKAKKKKINNDALQIEKFIKKLYEMMWMSCERNTLKQINFKKMIIYYKNVIIDSLFR